YGKVLVTGGTSSGASGALSSAEVYDPATNTWSPPGMAGDTATMLTLHNGKVLLAGGDANGMARLYDPATNTLTTSTMMFAVATPTAPELADGRVLVTGGINSGHVTVRAQVFDPNTLTWSLTGSMNTPRIYHTATRLADGTGMVLVAGGINDGGSPLASA